MPDPTALRHKVAIVGAAETDSVGVQPDKSMLQLHAESAMNALRDAGLTPADVDGVATAGPSPAAVAEYLGIIPRYVDGTSVGGCSFLIHVRHAVAAIAAGMVDTVLVTHGESGRSRVGMARPAPAPGQPAGQFEAPFGPSGPPSMFSIPVARYMKQFGVTEEQLAEVAVSTRKWASLNPKANMRDPITVDDVLNSRLIAWPLHLLNCCLVTDGGGALVLVSEERARDFPKKPVYVLGAGESVEHVSVSRMRDFWESKAYKTAGENAFRMAGVGIDAIDHTMLYDAFTHTPVYMLEALGIAKPGEGTEPFVSGRAAPGGDFPINTNGGGLSYTHTGMYGMFAMQESIAQLRGEAGERQVADVEVGLVHGAGGMFSAGATLLFSNS